MAKAKKQDWFDKWKKRTEIRAQWADLAMRYLELYIETNDWLYWEAYKEACHIESFHNGIAKRMFNYHHPEFKY